MENQQSSINLSLLSIARIFGVLAGIGSLIHAVGEICWPIYGR